MTITGAAAGAVRFTDAPSKHVHLYLHEGLDPAFVVEERCLDMGECLCGEAAQRARPAIHVISPARPANELYKCHRFGYRTVSVFTIRVKRNLLGVFNLYFGSRANSAPRSGRCWRRWASTWERPSRTSASCRATRNSR